MVKTPPKRADLLDNYAEFSSIVGRQTVTPIIRPSERIELTPEAKQRRRDRFSLLNKLQKFTSKDRICGCHKYRHAGNDVIKLKGHHETGKSFFTGLQRCGYAQFCPVCGGKIAAVRSAEIAEGVDIALAEGYGVYMLTLTAQHELYHTLKELRGLIAPAWGAVTSGRAWKQDVQDFGLEGFIRAWDETWGEVHGWHPHYHVLVFTSQPLTRLQEDDLHMRMFGRWSRFVTKKGYKRPSEDATYFERIKSQRGIGRYLNKLSLGIGMEMTRSDLKKAKKAGSLNHWQILEGLALTSEAYLYDLWMEWEAEMGGVQLVRWSNGLKKHFGINELTDKQIAEAEESWTWERIISNEEWALLSMHPHHIPLLHSCIHTHGPEAVDPFFAWLAETVHAPPAMA